MQIKIGIFFPSTKVSLRTVMPIAIPPATIFFIGRPVWCRGLDVRFLDLVVVLYICCQRQTYPGPNKSGFYEFVKSCCRQLFGQQLFGQHFGKKMILAFSVMTILLEFGHLEEIDWSCWKMNSGLNHQSPRRKKMLSVGFLRT
jgi:hypothetical protein